jgi:hypothetical protein
MQNGIRNAHGSALTEMGPALFILLIVGVLPILDLMFAGSAYCACVLLNDLELREASRVPASDANAAISTIAHDWQFGGIGQFIGVIGEPQSRCTYNLVHIEGSINPGTETYVNISTTVTVKPAFPIPFFGRIPALGGPATYEIVGRRILEEQSLAPIIE